MIDGGASCLESLFNDLDITLEAKDFVEFFFKTRRSICRHIKKLINGDFGMAYGRAQIAEPLAEAPTPCEARVQVSRMRQVPLQQYYLDF